MTDQAWESEKASERVLSTYMGGILAQTIMVNSYNGSPNFYLPST